MPHSNSRPSAAGLSLGFERQRGFYELACVHFRSAGPPGERPARDLGLAAGRGRARQPQARRERKVALLVFFLSIEPALAGKPPGCHEVARGGRNSWCYSLYRLTTHHPKDGGGNKWLRAVFGLELDELDDPFGTVLRFVQCRRAGPKYIVHVDTALFDPAAVVLSLWDGSAWQQSPRLRLEILYDLMRQVPRWTPLTAGAPARTSGSSPGSEVQPRAAWEDIPVYLGSIAESRRVRLVGLNHQVFRRARIGWQAPHRGDETLDLRKVGAHVENETAAQSRARLAAEVGSQDFPEPFHEDLEELTVFIGSAEAHRSWLRHTGFRPESYGAAESFWRLYLAKLARLRPRAHLSLYVVDDVSPLVLYLERFDGSMFLKWTPAMFGAYHPGDPGWNLFWAPGAPPPPHFVEITYAMRELAQRAKPIPIATPTGAANASARGSTGVSSPLWAILSQPTAPSRRSVHALPGRVPRTRE